MVVNGTPVRYSPEFELLQDAISGSGKAAESVVEQLASPYPGIKQKILEALHENSDSRVWGLLLNCLALNKWSEELPLSLYTDPSAAQRLDLSIVDAYLEDSSESETNSKIAALKSAMGSGKISLRNAAAYIAGLRGDPEAIPFLADMLVHGSRRWQLRAIRAVSSIPSAESAALLVQILIHDHDIYHQEARQGLSKLGHLARQSLQGALDHSDLHIRWHAARGLAEIGDYGGLWIIAEALNDENPTVRWVSSDLLANIGIKGVPAILSVIVRKPLSEECRQSSRHALLSIKSYRAQECLKPIVSALSSPSTKLVAQLIAERLQKDWSRIEMYISGSLQSIDSPMPLSHHGSSGSS